VNLTKKDKERRVYRFAALATILLALLVQQASCQTVSSAIRIKTGSPKTALESFVINDGVGFLSKMFSDSIDTSGSGSTFDVVIGTPQNNPLISQHVNSGNIVLPTGKYAGQGYAIKTIGGTIYLAAFSDTGLSPGIYDLLQQYGAYFLISNEILPQQTAFSVKNINVSVAPAFRYYGLLPWDNFLCGMSGWNEEDFMLCIDRMVRMRLNFIEFHFYPGLAYYNETYSDGSASATSDHVADWENSFQPSQMVGAAAFGTMSTFGTRQWWQNQAKGNVAQEDSCEAMLKRIIDYAHARGLSTVVGFCLMQPRGGDFAMTTDRGWDPMPDPLNAKNVNLEVDRYRRLVQLYPNSDYYWMWQAEAGGNLWNTVTNDAAATTMRNQFSYWNPKGGKGGDIDYGYLFMQTVSKLTSAERSKIATGGWDMSEIFPGFDRDCPKEIIFHGMNSWDTREGISEATNDYKVSAGRRTWMTDWWEYDGLVWFPEFRVKKQETMYKACVANNVEAVTLDGWKQSGVEHNIKYLAEFVWNPTLIGSQFYADYSEKVYGAPAASTLTNFYIVNDSLEPTIPAATTGDYRVMNISEGWQPLQLSSYVTSATDLTSSSWTSIVSECQTLETQQQALINRDQAFSTSLQSLRSQLNPTGQYWLDLMTNRLDFRVLYVQGLVDINKSYVDFNTAGKASGIAPAKTAAFADLNNGLEQMYLSILKVSECARNTSDLGLIGQVNILDYNVLKQFITSNGGVVATARGTSRVQPLTNSPSNVRMVSVYALNGKLLSRQIGTRQEGLLPKLRSGVYFVNVSGANGGSTTTKRLVVNGVAK
jgi:hypothetical protein